MALGFVTTDHPVTGVYVDRQTLIACDASYPTGGYAVTPTNLGLPGGVDWGIASIQNDGAGVAISAAYDPVAGTLKLYGSTGELANATNAAAVTVSIVARGGY